MVIDDTMCLMSLICKIITDSGGIQSKKLVNPNRKLALFWIKLYLLKQNPVQERNQGDGVQFFSAISCMWNLLWIHGSCFWFFLLLRRRNINTWWTRQVNTKEGKIPYVKPQKSYLLWLYSAVIITENKTLSNGHLLVHSELEKSDCSFVYLQVNKMRPNIKYKQEVTQT